MCPEPQTEPPSGVRVLLVGSGDEGLLEDGAADVFDGPMQPSLLREFLEDPRHHLAVAIDESRIVGFASAVHYVHPDKAPELWVNEVGVAPGFRGRGLGRRLLERLLLQGKALGCRGAWVLTDRGNPAAEALYRSAGGREVPGEAVAFEFDL